MNKGILRIAILVVATAFLADATNVNDLFGGTIVLHEQFSGESSVFHHEFDALISVVHHNQLSTPRTDVPSTNLQVIDEDSPSLATSVSTTDTSPVSLDNEEVAFKIKDDSISRSLYSLGRLLI